MVSIGARLAKRLRTAICGGEHIAFMNGGEGAAGVVLDAVGGIMNENARGIEHDAGSLFTARCGGFLRAQERRFHRVSFHDDVGERGDEFLFVSELLAYFWTAPPAACRKIFFVFATIFRSRQEAHRMIRERMGR